MVGRTNDGYSMPGGEGVLGPGESDVAVLRPIRYGGNLNIDRLSLTMVPETRQGTMQTFGITTIR